MRKVFLTGVTGQDGPYLIEALRQRGDVEVTALVRRCARDLQPDLGVDVMEGDVRDPGITKRIADTRPDEIYNLAALSHVGHSFDCPDDVIQTNTLGCLHMLEAAKLSGARFYQASTSEIFGNSPGPQNELTPLAPASPYAVAKVAAYHLVRLYREAYGVFACNGILFNHESPRRGADFVTQKVCKAAARIAKGEQGKLQLGNLDAKRDWGHAVDYARGMVMMMRADRADDYVLATGISRTVAELCDVAFRAAGIDDWRRFVESDPDLMRPLDVQNLCGDSSKARSKLGWMPQVTFEDMIEEMVNAQSRH
jgi:GDPmannose 4,6-dehydratase